MTPSEGGTAAVLDLNGVTLSRCPAERALKLVQAGRATLVSQEPLTIQLDRVVELPVRQPEPAPSLAGRRVLLHVCCGPCATYVVARLRVLGAQVTGHWFNPNIHPYSEHQRRRETLAGYAREIELPMIWEEGYEMPAFLRAVVGHEARGERCALCYRLRLERTAQIAAHQGFDWLTTTLLISPYQEQRTIQRLGEELAEARGFRFYMENFRQGFAEHRRLAREHDLYQQRYCGCLYSEWEALDPAAVTATRPGREKDG